MFRAFDSTIWELPPHIESSIEPFFNYIGLPYLSKVIHITILTCVSSFLLQSLSHKLSPLLFPNHYPKIPAKAHDWDLHIVSWSQTFPSFTIN